MTKLFFAFAAILLLSGQVLSQDNDYAPKHEAGYCVWYDQCTPGPKAMNCLYNGPARELNDTKGQKIMESLCPELRGQKTCCSTKQLAALENNLGTMRQLAGRCPACWNNFRKLYCEMTCSRDQSMFMDPVTVFGFGKQFIQEVAVFLSPQYKQALYDSCKDVIFPGNNEKIMNLLCGTTADKCTPQALLKYLGSTTNGFAPFTIDYPVNLTVPKVQWMEGTPYKCNESFIDPQTNRTANPCSCQDCHASCPVPPPEVPPAKPKKIMGLEALTFAMGLVFIVFVIVFFVVVCIVKKPKKYAMLPDQPQASAKYTSSASVSVPSRETTPTPGFCERLGGSLEGNLRLAFTWWGKWCSLHPLIVMFACAVFIGILACGLTYFQVTTDPVELWSAPDSEARREKDIFDSKFSPFYRTEQLIIQSTYPNNTGYVHYGDEKFISFGPIFHMDLLNKTLELQNHITNMPVEYAEEGKPPQIITLQDICFSPLEPQNKNCTIQSIFQYFQNDLAVLNKCLTSLGDPCDHPTVHNDPRLADFHDHFIYCSNAPTSTSDPTFKEGCLGTFGGPVNPNVVLGGFDGSNYKDASTLIITFVVNNHKDKSKLGKAMAWEKAFIEYMKNYVKDPKNADLTISFTSERSIEDELNRESNTDVVTILLSYMIMFAYISLSLGQLTSCYNIMIGLKFCLGFGGILIVLCSVIASLGFWSYLGQPATLIIIEVVPFLVLAVGVDNIFILVQTYQRNNRFLDGDVPSKIGEVLGDVAPSMLLTSLSETVAFALGAMSTMPAVRVFSQYAAVAVLVNFLLQITCFVALMSLDAKRQNSNRLDILCCVKMKKSNLDDNHDNEGLQYKVMKGYASVLLSEYVRPVVIACFVGLLCLSISLIPKLDIGLDQELSMPQDSYVLDWFRDMKSFLHVGSPVYFVLDGGYDYEHVASQNKICGLAGCNQDSLVQQVYIASQQPSHSRIAMTASSWLDDYFSWIDPSGQDPCCRMLHKRVTTCKAINVTHHGNKTTPPKMTCTNHTVPVSPPQFCNATVDNPLCLPCLDPSQQGMRPTGKEFDKFLPFYLRDNPETVCTKGGHAAYGHALQLNKPGSKYLVNASYFMSYHTILKTSQDYTAALRNAREIAKKISVATGAHVFPYSVFYVFYEQYLTIARDSWQNLLWCLAAIFVVTFFLLGFNVGIALIVTFTVALIVTNLLGLMYLWNISLNAVSLVNLVMAVGIAVEFCSHIARAFTVNTNESRVQRAIDAVAKIGGSVVSGITLTKIVGIFVLAFAKSQIFEVFYFRMYLGIVILGASHGLIFLPVLLSYVGPAPSVSLRIAEELSHGGQNEQHEKQPLLRSPYTAITS